MNPMLTDAVPVPAPPPAGWPLDEPTFEECHAEFNRLYEASKAGVIDPDNAHPNQFVAFYDGRVLGYGSDGLSLRNEQAVALGVHPARLIVEFLRVFGGDRCRHSTFTLIRFAEADRLRANTLSIR